MRMRAIVLAIASTSIPAAAHADPKADQKAVCVDATSKAQRLRAAHQLVEAREQLRACAASVCPAVIQGDCATWLGEVEAALPTVVVTARTQDGEDVVDVAVTVDGQPFATRLAGEAMPMNAGVHAFHFEGAGAKVDRSIVVREGEKNQPVTVVLAPPASTTTGPGPVEPLSVRSAQPVPSAASGREPFRSAGRTTSGGTRGRAPRSSARTAPAPALRLPPRAATAPKAPSKRAALVRAAARAPRCQAVPTTARTRTAATAGRRRPRPRRSAASASTSTSSPWVASGSS